MTLACRRALLTALLTLVLASCDSAVEPIVPVATTIRLQASSLTFSSLGQAQQLSATVLDQAGDAMGGAGLVWASLSESVATVSGAGVVTAVANGNTMVTVSSGSASATVSVTVGQIAVSMTLSLDSASFSALGDTVLVAASVEDAGGSDVAGAVVAWTSLDPAVATVSPAGVLTAVANGTTAVTAISESLLGTVSVTVSQLPGSIGLSTDSVDFAALGDTTQLVATVSDSGGSGFGAAIVTWTSSDSTVAIVSGTGLVTAVDNGVATVTATSGSVTDTSTVTVQQVVAAIGLQPDSVVFADLGETAALVALVQDALGVEIVAPTLSWTSGDEDIATVDGSGVVTAVATGTAAISVAAGGSSASISARVVPELTLLAAGPANLSAEVASAVSMSVRVEDLLGAAYEGATVTWSVDSGVGAITSATQSLSDATGHAGAVWALGTGAGTQLASASVATRGSVVVVAFVADAVAGAATDAFLLADSVLLSAAGETVFLAPSFLDQYGNTAAATSVTWNSSDPGVAMVAADGLVTGQGSGTTYVTASLGSPTDSILVTVVPRGAITVTFDDGWLTTYTEARAVMQEFDLRGNVSVYTEAVDFNFPAYMDLTQLQDLHDDGWSMVSHTVSHDSLSTLSVPVLDFELRTSQQWLIDRGFDRASHIFIVPYHIWPDSVRPAVATYYTAARGVSANAFVPDSLVSWQPSNPYELTAISVDELPYTTVAGRNILKAMLERTRDEGRFLDVLFHQVPSQDVPALRETLDIINMFRDRVLPYHELYPKFARVVG